MATTELLDNPAQASSRKLRIAFLSTGGFSHLPPYLRYFSQQGHDVHSIVYTSYVHPDSYGATIHDVSTGTNPRGRRLAKWRYFRSLPRIRKVIREILPDIVNGHYVTSSGPMAMLCGFRPYVLSVHGSDLITSMKSVIWRNVLKVAFRRAGLVHTVSDDLGDLAAKLGASKDKTLTLTHGVDTSLFRYQPPRDLRKPLKLLCTRVLGDVYDPMTILAACRILKRKGVAFEITFAAGGVLQPEMEAFAKQNGLEEQVAFVGGFENDELPGFLENHDVYLSASLWDGTSISLLEAMSSGVVPVITRIPSNLRWIEDGKNGLMFEPGNAEEVASQILRIQGDEELRRMAIQRNHEIIEEKADRATNMRILEQRYHELILEAERKKTDLPR